MRLSSKLPPAGFTRAEPLPPRSRRLPVPRPALAAAVIGGMLVLLAGYGAIAVLPAPASGDAPSVAPRPGVPSPRVAAPSSASSGAPSSAAPAGPKEAASARGGVIRTPRPRRGRAAASRVPRPRTRAPFRAPRPRSTRTTRPAPPSWAAAECRRRFPDDPRRRAACTAVLAEMFGK